MDAVSSCHSQATHHMNHAGKRDLMREHLAHLAARFMAEDGITDYAHAKRKAARQMGIADTRHLPGNNEIDAALHSFRNIFQHQTHPIVLHHLRAEALKIMLRLAAFRPYLTGSVLSGTAGAHSDINLIIFSDDAKAVLLFLLKQHIEFKESEWKVRMGGRDEVVPSFTLVGESGIQTHVIVLPENARHSGSRHPGTHADLAALEALLVKEAMCP